jgi:hypothetical protein
MGNLLVGLYPLLDKTLNTKEVRGAQVYYQFNHNLRGMLHQRSAR